MKLTSISADISEFPEEIRPFLSGAPLYDSSCSPEARVIFIDRDKGYFLKSSPKGTLGREAAMIRYFHAKGLSARVIAFISGARDYLLTEKIAGEDCISEKHLANPERLCEILAERLYLLHNTDYTDCPIQNHTEIYLARAAENRRTGSYDKSHFPDSFGYKNEREAWETVEKYSHLLKNDTLLHGDYCLPNIILKDGGFSGYIDLDNAGVGDRHIDLFWGAWSLFFNLKTDKYRTRFFDAYGKNLIDPDLLRVVAAVEVFG